MRKKNEINIRHTWKRAINYLRMTMAQHQMVTRLINMRFGDDGVCHPVCPLLSTYLQLSEHIYGEIFRLADNFSLCSMSGSNTTNTISVKMIEIGMHDGLHQLPRPHL